MGIRGEDDISITSDSVDGVDAEGKFMEISLSEDKDTLLEDDIDKDEDAVPVATVVEEVIIVVEVTGYKHDSLCNTHMLLFGCMGIEGVCKNSVVR